MNTSRSMATQPTSHWKPGARVLGIDDGPFTASDARVDLVGVVCRAATGYVETILHTTVERDGDDATGAIVRMVNASRTRPNIVATMTQNSTVAGFNTLDLEALHAGLGHPVVAVSRGSQDWAAMRRALLDGGIAGGPEKWQRIQGNESHQSAHRGLTLVPAGMAEHEARSLVDLCTLRGHMPEPLRLAHLIGAGWVLGESHGQ